MKKSLLLICSATLFFLFFDRFASAQVNEYSLQPVDLRIAPDDSIVQFNINIKTRDTIGLFQIPLYAEGTSNPVLDTILTGGLGDPNPPAFAVPGKAFPDGCASCASVPGRPMPPPGRAT